MALLNEQVALITGAGGGIGRGIALNFAKEGAAVVVAELDVTSGEAVVAELKALGAQAVFIKTDVCSKADIEAAVQLAVDQFGGLDILVNNAFAPTPNVLLEEKTDAMLEQTLGSTVWAAWWAMKAALPHMKARGGGKIINFYSIDIEIGAWLHGDYNTAKAAIVGLTRSAASEWGAVQHSNQCHRTYRDGRHLPQTCRRKPGLCRNVRFNASAGPLWRA